MNQDHPAHDLLKIEVAESEKYSGSNWCAELFDKFTLGRPFGMPGLEDVRPFLNLGSAWMVVAQSQGASGALGEFFSKVTASQELTEQVKSVTNRGELIELASQNGYEITRKDLANAASSTFEAWQGGLSSSVRTLFASASKDAELAKKLSASRCEDDIIDIGRAHGIQVTNKDLDAMNLKLDNLDGDNASQQLTAAILAINVLCT